MSEPQPVNRDMPRQAATGEPARNVNRLQRYMETNGFRYRQLAIDEIHGKKVDIKLMVPLSELQGAGKQGNEGWYRDAVRQALEKNDAIFKTTPQEKTYLFLETTEDWNTYVGDDPKDRKTKGDRHHGGAGEDILCFTPPGMRSETNAELENISAADYVKTVLDHETAHATIQAKYGRNLNGWINEAVPMLVCTDLSTPPSAGLAMRMYRFLQDYPEPPSDDILVNGRYRGREDKGPVMYTYGEQFLKWMVNRFSKGGSDEERKAVIVPLIDRIAAQEQPDLPSAFRDTFGLEYNQAYGEFVTFLKAASQALGRSGV